MSILTRRLGLALACLLATPALAQEPPAGAPAGQQEFLGIDLDDGSVVYNGRNSGRYCVYQTVEVFDARTGLLAPRRLRRCGRGLYVR